jgi:hypothetical protein
MRKRRFTAALALALLVLGLALVAVGCRDVEHRAVRERIAIDARVDSYVYNGADIYWYSDNHSSQTAHIAGDTGNVDVEGTANIAGAVTLQDDLTIAGALDADSTTAFADTVTLEAGSTLVGSSTTTGTHGVVMAVSGSFTHAITETETSILSVPANANIVDALLYIATDWNDGSSASVDIGPSGSTDTWANDLDINAVGDGTVHRIDGSNLLGAALGDVGASELDVHVVIAEGSDDASAGSATLYIWYQIDE